MLWDILQQGAHFYVCGDANAMAGDVEKEVLRMAVQVGGIAEDKAQLWLEQLAAEGRYQRDVWFS